MIIQDNGCYERYSIEIINSGDTATASAGQSIWNIQNIGSGVGIYSGKTGHTALFKTLVAGSNIDITSTDNTIVISSSGGTSSNINAANGLTKVGDNIVLGGTLTGNTTIDGDGNQFVMFGLNIFDIAADQLSIAGGTTQESVITTTDNSLSVQAKESITLGTTDFPSSFIVDANTELNADTSFNINTPLVNINALNTNVSGNSLNIYTTGNTIISGGAGFQGAKYNQNYASNFVPRSIPDVGFVTGFTNYIITNSNQFTISNQHKNTSIYFTNTGTTSVYIPDTVDSGLTFTSIRTAGAGIVTHIATGTSSLNSIGNNYSIEVENCASTWQYIGDSEWYGFGALGAQSTGGTSSLTANNGLTKVGSNVRLGGTLTGNTLIDCNSNYDFSLNNGRFININAYSGISISDGYSNSIVIDVSGINIGNFNLPATIYSMNGGSLQMTDASVSLTSNTGITIVGDTVQITGASNTFLQAGNQIKTNSNSVEFNIVTDFNIYNSTTNNFLSQSAAGTSINLDEPNGGVFSVNNSGTIFSIDQSGNTQLNLGSDATNDIYSRNSLGLLQRIAAGTGDTVLMMNSGATTHIYSKITSNNIAANAVTTTAINNSAVTIAKLANSAGGTRIIGRSANSAGVLGEIAATTDGQSLRRVGGVLGFGNASTVSFTVGTLPSAATAGQMIYVSDESGGAVIAFSDGSNWRRVTDRAIVS
ncbi:beta strand repeat-containing protein [Ohtaekwangia koreensis]|uniref:Uncharacterized protein n=1 Tax=Ohtaekwangia koreensis TaxID=688867 RepID=A0A1T5JPY3_9BACT|nr:hypothetical protein [Ohtaekwangia koreensis]SKC53424.1 hypothetical protein SAMN05660236_1341 [Ohtaekwangia koreensis]